jgi:hypothetical protein
MSAIILAFEPNLKARTRRSAAREYFTHTDPHRSSIDRERSTGERHMDVAFYLNNALTFLRLAKRIATSEAKLELLALAHDNLEMIRNRRP